MQAVVRVFIGMFDDEIDLYWLSSRFMKCLDQFASHLDKLVTIQLKVALVIFSIIKDYMYELKGICIKQNSYISRSL